MTQAGQATTPQPNQAPRAAPLFAWDHRTFVVIALCAIPAVLVGASGDPHAGVAMVFGLVPAAFSGVAPKRRGRARVLILAILLPVSLAIGGALKQFTNVWVAALVLAALAFGAALSWSKPGGRPLGALFVVPVAAVGLSFDSASVAAKLLGLMVASSILALGVALCFPERPSPAPAPPAPLPVAAAQRFGLQFATSIAIATGVGFHLDHTGWVAGSAGLVSRPRAEMQQFRSIWRVGSILASALIASLFLMLDPAPAVATIVAGIAVACAGGTQPSRAYIAPFFITIVLFILLEYPIPSEIELWSRFAERVLWVLAGVLIAYVVALILTPAVERATRHLRRA